MKKSANLSELWMMTIAGDQDAYGLVHSDLYPALYNYLYNMMREEELVDDLLQELFIKLWEKRSQIGIIANVRAYFYKTARSMAINHFRCLKSQAEKLENFDQPEMEFSIEDIIVADENNAHLKYTIDLALRTLPARQREVIYLKFYQGLDYPKIAEITGIKYQSVVNHVFRGLQTLRTEFIQAGSMKIVA